MRDYHAFRHTAIRYWERRRIIFNLALMPPSFVAYMLSAGISAGVGDRECFGIGTAALLFFASAVGANVCYTFAYALEFLFGSDEPHSRWLRFGRTAAFVVGTLFAMSLALVVGRNIADMEYSFR